MSLWAGFRAIFRPIELPPRERGEAVARENGVPFLETSAKTNVNVERAFADLSEAILDKRQDITEPAGSKSDWSQCGCRK